MSDEWDKQASRVRRSLKQSPSDEDAHNFLAREFRRIAETERRLGRAETATAIRRALHTRKGSRLEALLERTLRQLGAP